MYNEVSDEFLRWLDNYLNIDEKQDDDTESNVVSPTHYRLDNGKEAIDIIRDVLGQSVRAYYIGNIIKYLIRYKYKNGVEDLEKAKIYLEWLIELEGENHEANMEKRK